MAIAGKVAILPKGEWNSAVSYEKLDAVSYDNALYIAKKQSVGQVPTDGEYWMFCLQSIDYAEFEKIINGTTTVGIADKAINDKNGDDIVNTYAKKDDLTNFQNKDGDSKDNIVTFTSADDTTADAWTDVDVLATGEKHSSLLAKISTMFKNIRYIYTHFIKSENILETLEEIVANTQSGKVAGALAVKELNSNFVNCLKKSDVVNNLTTTTTNVPLSAAQGKVLNDKITNLSKSTTLLASISTNTAIPYTLGASIKHYRYIYIKVTADGNTDTLFIQSSLCSNSEKHCYRCWGNDSYYVEGHIKFNSDTTVTITQDVVKGWTGNPGAVVIYGIN